jgi:5-methylcytosine-specific restriction endonuclease McrA
MIIHTKPNLFSPAQVVKLSIELGMEGKSFSDIAKKLCSIKGYGFLSQNETFNLYFAGLRPKKKNRQKRKKNKVSQNAVFNLKSINPNSDSFLSSYEWRRIRMEAIKKYGARCMCCGATPQDGVTVINVDHIKPRRLFPALALDVTNLQVLCNVCNHGKGNWDMTDWRSELTEEQRSHILDI